MFLISTYQNIEIFVFGEIVVGMWVGAEASSALQSPLLCAVLRQVALSA